MADRKGDEQKKHDIYRLPEPDALPRVSVPEVSPRPTGEVRIHVVHKTSNQYGIDVSHYQSYINWEMVRTDDRVTFAYIKSTESSGNVDDCCSRNLTEARRAGIPVGIYHFFNPTVSPMLQYQNFISNLDLRRMDLIPVIDVERRGKGSLSAYQNRLKEFLKMVEKNLGFKPIIYTYQNFYNQYLAGEFTEYKFWIAKYAEDVPDIVDDVPVVMWQFSSTGSINGINGRVDCNVMLDNYTLRDIMLPAQEKRKK